MLSLYLVAAGLHIDSYSNHIFYRNPGLFILSGLVLVVCFYGLCSIYTQLLIFICILLGQAISYFVTPVVFGRRKIVLTQEALEEISDGLVGHHRRVFPLSSITDITLQVYEIDKKKPGLQRRSPLENMLMIILLGAWLFWIFDKSQLLILADEKGATTSIDVSYYYEQDIKTLVTFLKDRCGFGTHIHMPVPGDNIGQN